MSKEAKQWIKIAEDDIDMMRIAMERRKYAYAVLFAQQAVEKNHQSLHH
jgi:HEPN domain-containing protein